MAYYRATQTPGQRMVPVPNIVASGNMVTRSLPSLLFRLDQS